MTAPNAQHVNDLSTAIEAAIEHCVSHGLVASSGQFLEDFDNSDLVDRLALSPQENEHAYGSILSSLRFQAAEAAAATVAENFGGEPRPVPAMVESGAAPEEAVAGDGIQDGAFVDDQVEFVDPYNQPEGTTSVTAADGMVIPVPVPVPAGLAEHRTVETAPAELPPEAGPDLAAGEAEAPELASHDRAMAQKVVDLLGLLPQTPVTNLRLGRLDAAGIRSPFQITEAQRELVIAVIGPLMAAAGIVGVEIPPSYFDVTRGKEVELDLEDPEDAAIFIRAALRW